MEPEEFRVVLERAVSGNNEDIEKILLLYKPVIDRAAHIGKKFDEDLKQYILMHIVKGISKFNLNFK